jgi:hypothetical protein
MRTTISTVPFARAFYLTLRYVVISGFVNIYPE